MTNNEMHEAYIALRAASAKAYEALLRLDDVDVVCLWNYYSDGDNDVRERGELTRGNLDDLAWFLIGKEGWDILHVLDIDLYSEKAV